MKKFVLLGAFIIGLFLTNAVNAQVIEGFSARVDDAGYEFHQVVGETSIGGLAFSNVEHWITSTAVVDADGTVWFISGFNKYSEIEHVMGGTVNSTANCLNEQDALDENGHLIPWDYWYNSEGYWVKVVVYDWYWGYWVESKVYWVPVDPDEDPVLVPKWIEIN